jgi:outer membrane protein OmpA-like peptidoglycan-associated protein
MFRARQFCLPALLSSLMLLLATPVQAEDTIDVTGKTLDANGIQQGLFPDDECEQLKAAGFKCMGFKPAVKFSLPAVAFKPGSAELPEPLKAQLDTFAEALRGRPADSRKVRVEGHADASGDPELNLALSQRRAETAKDYLVAKGVAPQLLKAVGVGARDPKVAGNPLAAENRRVVIGRDHSTDGAAAN